MIIYTNYTGWRQIDFNVYAYYQAHDRDLRTHPAQLASAGLAFAHLCGQMAAADAGMHVYFRKAGLLDGGGGASVNTAPIDVCRPPRGADALDELAHFPPFLSRFLWAFACSRYNPPSNTAHTHPGRLLQRDGDEAAMEARALALVPVFSALFASGGEYGDLIKLSAWGRRIAVRLLIDGAGVSEKVLTDFKSEIRSISSPKRARQDMYNKELDKIF
jgi:hypothetical protein